MAIVSEVKELADALGVGDLIKLGVSLTEKGIEAESKRIAKKVEEKESLVQIAEVHSSDYHVKLADAKRWLEEDGLKVEAVVVKPDIAFKDCVDMEIVATNFKLNQKVKPGTRVILKYVTTEVIDASQKIFDEVEKQRMDAEEEKVAKKLEQAQKRAEQNEKSKLKLSETVSAVKGGIKDATASAQKGIGGAFSSLTKKVQSKKTKDNPDNEE